MEYPNSVCARAKLGIGTWSWGDRLIWGYGDHYQRKDLQEAFEFCINNGFDFFDTAEGYGQGRSEQLLGEFIKAAGKTVTLATKFMPYPWRLSKESLKRALIASIKRLQINSVDLYQVHIPLPPVKIETWMQAMAEVVQLGLTRQIGVSNFNRTQTQRAFDALKREGLSLSSNQVEYSLLDRQIEKNGVLALCKELGITVIAYSPLAMGILSGKYHPGNPVKGYRGAKYNMKFLSRIQPLIQVMKRIGAEHGKTPAQVAINWTICKGTFPIPGVKNYQQAEHLLGSVGWELSPTQVADLDRMSDQILST